MSEPDVRGLELGEPTVRLRALLSSWECRIMYHRFRFSAKNITGYISKAAHG